MIILRGNLCGFVCAAVVVVVLLFGHPCLSADDASYNIEQSWFKPSLTVDNDPELCMALLNGYTNFFRQIGDINPLAADFKGEKSRERGQLSQNSGTGSLELVGKVLHEVPWKSLENEGDDLRIAEIFLDGQYKAFVRRNYSIGWREGYFNDIFITQPLSGYGLTKDDYESFFTNNSFGVLGGNNEKELLQVLDKDERHTRDYHLNFYTSIANIYTAKNAIYLLLSNDSPIPGTYMLVRMLDAKNLAHTCSLQTRPQQSQIDEQLEWLAEVKALKEDLMAMMGVDGNCGTLNSLSGAKNSLTGVLDEILYRPWNIPPGDWVSRLSPIDSNFFVWGHSGVWNYHVYQRYKSNLPQAEKQLAQFYRKNFRLDENSAHKLAEKALALAIVSGFDHGSTDDTMGDLHMKLLTGISVDELEKEDITTKTDMQGEESLLTFAIGHPELVNALLAKGLDPNRQNSFGKTPLMYAAQFNDVESAKIILKHGALTEAETIRSNDSCNNTIGVKNVSALHYAVRYASAEFIKLLLDYDAPIYTKDSEGKTPFEYLMVYGDVGTGGKPTANANPPERNAHLTADDCRWLQSILKPLEEGEKGRLSKKTNLQAEQLYKQGKLREAYASLKRAISLDPSNERAKANQALVSLKLGNLGESAQLSTALIAAAQSKAEKANAYFNLGLACRQEAMSGNNYNVINYDGDRFCDNDSYVSQGKRIDRSAFASFLAAYHLQQTPERLNAILQYFEQSDSANEQRLLKFSDDDSGVKSLYFYGQSWFFLVDANKEVSFKRLAILINNIEQEMNFANKEVIPLSSTLKLVHWSVPSPYYGTWNFPIKLDDMIYNETCSFVFAADTKLVEIVSPKERYGWNARKNKVLVNSALSSPKLIVLYGNNVDWALEGDLTNIAGVYVHGQSTVSQPIGKTVPVYSDNMQVEFDPKDTSFNRYTVSKIGLAVDSIITVDESGKAEVTE